METVFIDRKGCQLAINNQRLQISHPDETHRSASVPLHLLRSLVISSDCVLSSALLRRLGRHQISVLCINHRSPDLNVAQLAPAHGNVNRRLKQYRLLTRQPERLRLARLIVRAKLRGQQMTLRQMADKRPVHHPTVNNGLQALQQIRRQLSQAQSLSELMGLEGLAARYYYAQLSHYFAPALAFEQRQKRPATDPVNATLSLTYSILYYEANRALLAYGLDPMLPILHEPAYGRASLACDGVELLRGAVDLWVWRAFANGTVRSEDFTCSQSLGCRLGKAGRARYYRALAEALLPWRQYLRRWAGALTRILDQPS